MSTALSRTEWSERMADEVREVVREHVRQLGWKRGLHDAARRLGVTERRAKALYTGEPLKLLASEWHAAQDARMALRRDRAAQLRAELAEIERQLHVATDQDQMAAGVGTRLGLGR